MREDNFDFRRGDRSPDTGRLRCGVLEEIGSRADSRVAVEVRGGRDRSLLRDAPAEAARPYVDAGRVQLVATCCARRGNIEPLSLQMVIEIHQSMGVVFPTDR